MKKIKTKSGNVLCIEVSEEAYLIEPIDNPKFKYSIRFTNCPEIHNVEYEELEPIGKLSELTDKDCEEFVKWGINNNGLGNCNYGGYFNYIYNIGIKYPYNSAKESFISLLQSEGIDTNKELLIIKIL